MAKYSFLQGKQATSCEVDKPVLRRALLQKRAALAPSQVEELGRQAQHRLMEHEVWQAARQVVLYMPVRNEMPTWDMLQDAWLRDKDVFLPRCDPQRKGAMCFALCSCEQELVPGCYGIAEPDPACCPAVDMSSMGFAPDVAVIPGVGFDRRGNRLGFGGGYYDRILAHDAMQRATLVGYAYAFQVVAQIPAEPWDKSVHALCTNEALLWL